MKQVQYGNLLLMANSTAFELWEGWQKAVGKDKDLARKKLDQHIREVELRHETTHGKMPAHLVNFKIGLVAQKQLDQTQLESYNKDSKEQS